MSPAPPITHLFVSIFEEENVVDTFDDCIESLKRFTNGGIGMWDNDPDPTVDNTNWTLFKSTMNSCGLEWKLSPRSQLVVFMDMTISFKDGKIETALYAKPLSLYLYNPPTHAMYRVFLQGYFTT